MGIRKATFTFTFLFDDSVDTEEFVRSLEVEQIIGNCDDGFMLGQVTEAMVITDVPNEQVAAEEKALGGDGTFFADRDELEHARLDAEGDE